MTEKWVLEKIDNCHLVTIQVFKKNGELSREVKHAFPNKEDLIKYIKVSDII